MRRKRWLACLASAAVLYPRPAFAWDELGHMVVAQIAWDNLTPQARSAAVTMLCAAPPRSGLLRGFPSCPTSAARQRALFLRAAIWPDLIRTGSHPGHSFHNRDRHFVNLFWRQTSDFSTPRPDNRPPAGELLNDLPRLLDTVERPTNRGEAALALAWVIHLVGDIHQPLHASSRVTPLDPDGDRGGNNFKLGTGDDPPSLHGFWDGVISRTTQQGPSESDDRFATRVALDLERRFPRSRFAELNERDPRTWAEESVRIAQTSVYRLPLRRDHFPSRVYLDRARSVAERRIALAGYRLARVLGEALD